MKYIAENKGSTILVAPIIWCITIFTFVFFIIMSIRVMEPFLIYQKISETSLKYIFIIEEYGFLTEKDKENMEFELAQKGIDTSRLKIFAPDKKRDYGELVTLDVEYIHKMRLLGNRKKVFSPEYKEEDIKICISKKGVSKC